MAIKKGVKAKEHENLTHANIEKVISLLEAKPPITKKEACEILNISYNTARLTKIIEGYHEEVAEDARRRAANRGKPLADYEKQSIIESVLDGDSIAEISKRLYRSTASINKTIDEIGIPERSENYAKIALLPEQCVREVFEPGEMVWVCSTNSIGVILEPEAHSKSKATGENVYAVYSFERIEKLENTFFFNCNLGDYGGRYGNYRASDLGSLEHLKKYGIDVSKTYRKHFPRSIKKHLGMEVK